LWYVESCMFSLIPILKNYCRNLVVLTQRGVAIMTLFLPVVAGAASDEALFQHARDAYSTRNVSGLTEDAAKLSSRQYVLAPYAEYWLMLLKLEQARDEEIQNFLAQYADFPFAERVRGEWLKKLAKQKDWVPFFEEYPIFKRDDLVVQCYAQLGKLEIGDVEAPVTGRRLWLTTTELPSNCNTLFDEMQKSGMLSKDDIWTRFRMALHEGRPQLAKDVASRLPEVDADDLKLLDVALQSPQALLEKTPITTKTDKKKTTFTPSAPLDTRYGIEVNLYALDRLGRIDSTSAASVMMQLATKLSAEDQAFGWARIAYHAARQHNVDALEYFAMSQDTVLDKEQMAWKVRAALRAGDWSLVLSTTTAMQKSQAEESAWRYWKARALKAHQKMAEANAILGPLSKERHYYGLLAAEELESAIGGTQEQYSVTDNEVAAVANMPAIRRAYELQNLEMRWEAKAEWAWATRGFNDKQLLAAAEYALRQKWYDIAISTADNTKSLHDFNLRYPVPYRDLFRAAAHNEDLDEAWIYGLVRQESRFMHFAKSGVGAAGLMQVMPATAKWAAKRMGMSGYSSDKINELPINVGIGSYYMRYTLEQMNGQMVMATAAYNAGPSRAKRWKASEPLEAAIYIESIPFLETRGYVQKVMTNAQIYAPRLGAQMRSLKDRIGIVPGRDATEAIPHESEKGPD